MGSSNLEQQTMQFFVLLATFAAAFAAPAPQDEDIPAALPYVHEDIAALPYVHEDIAAEAYVHDEPVETNEIAAEPYVHEEPAAPAAPVFTCAAFPYATHAYTIPVAAAPVATKTEAVAPATAPVAYSYAAPYVYAVHHTGCVNSVGSIVPCAV